MDGGRTAPGPALRATPLLSKLQQIRVAEIHVAARDEHGVVERIGTLVDRAGRVGAAAWADVERSDASGRFVPIPRNQGWFVDPMAGRVGPGEDRSVVNRAGQDLSSIDRDDERPSAEMSDDVRSVPLPGSESDVPSPAMNLLMHQHGSTPDAASF